MRFSKFKHLLKKTGAFFLCFIAMFGAFASSGAINAFALDNWHSAGIVEVGGTRGPLPFILKGDGTLPGVAIFYSSDSGSGHVYYSDWDPYSLNNLNVAYCANAEMDTPWGGNDTTLSVGDYYWDEGAKAAVGKAVNEGYPGNYDYWKSKGIDNPAAQAQATQLAIWAILHDYGVNGNTSVDWTGNLFGYYKNGTDYDVIGMSRQIYNAAKGNSGTLASTISGSQITTVAEGSNFKASFSINPVSYGNTEQYDLTINNLPAGAVITKDGVSIGSSDTASFTGNQTINYTVTFPQSGNNNRTISYTAKMKRGSLSKDNVYLFQNGTNVQDIIATNTAIYNYAEVSGSGVTPDIQYISVSVQKTSDDTGENVPGATYGLYTDSACTNLVSTAVTNEWGFAVWEGLKYGNYYAKELATPNDYLLSDEVITVGVDSYNDKWDNYNGYTLYIKYTTDKPGFAVSIHKTSKASTAANTIVVPGAVYGLYYDAGCKNLIGTAVTNEYGFAIWEGLDSRGTYYARELSAPTGYVVSPAILTISKTDNDGIWSGGKWNGYDLYMREAYDYPQSDPVSILLKKVDAVTGENVPAGDMSLAGAQYTVKCWAGDYSQVPEGVNPTYTWIFETDEDGFLYLNNTWKVGGDDLYVNSYGETALPVGVVTIQETKAPAGYNINSTVYTESVCTKEAWDEEEMAMTLTAYCRTCKCEMQGWTSAEIGAHAEAHILAGEGGVIFYHLGIASYRKYYTP